MVKIAVFVKQVPASSEVETNALTGALERQKTGVRINPYDLSGLEAALRAREALGGSVTAITMGPVSAREVLVQAFSMGVDEGVLVSDQAFAGADVYATSYTLSQAVKALGGFDLLVCGRQTTDGDTAQTGPALATHLDIPCLTWVREIREFEPEHLKAIQKLSGGEAEALMRLPCLVSVEREGFHPRLPSLRLKRMARQKEICTLTIENFEDRNPSHYGQEGSPTKVERIFIPEKTRRGQRITGEKREIVEQLKALVLE